MWGNPQLTNMFILMVMVALVKIYWEQSQRQPSVNTNPDGVEITPCQREWIEKSVRGYREAQENRVWQRWNRSMFEPSTTASPKPRRKRQGKSRAI